MKFVAELTKEDGGILLAALDLLALRSLVEIRENVGKRGFDEALHRDALTYATELGDRLIASAQQAGIKLLRPEETPDG